MKELNKSTFEQTIKEDTLTIVDFWADWCMPCKIFAPVLEELATEFEGKVAFCKVNIDENGDLAQEYSIDTIPTLIFYKSGKEIERFVGVRGKDEMKTAISSQL